MRLRLAALAACVAFPAFAFAQQAPIQLPGTIGVTAYDTGSGGYNQAVAIGNALKQNLNVNLRILPGRNDVARQAPLRDKRVPLSYHGVGSYFSQEGVFEFAARDWGPQPVRVLLLNNSDQLLTIITARDANIRTLQDLRGKRVAWVAGAPALNANVEALMAAVGLTWNDVQRVQFGGYGQSMQGIINGQADAGWASSIAGPLYQLEASPRGLHYPPLPASDTKAWAWLRENAPWFVQANGRDGAGLSAERPVHSTAYPYPILIAYADADEALVYNFTRAMLTYFKDYETAAPGNAGWALARQRFDWAMPYHPGAIRALREAGAWKPEHDAHNEALIRRQGVMIEAWRRYTANAPENAEAFKAGWMKARAEALRAANLPVVFQE
ncbi:MAG: TAXI family TRAP transporter solute-binding subunit [Acetobacteraceae bacterium]|nr:TAXI family TRAP transporter solute-binding subunit [Acetobacteraceae bacterium]